MRGNLNADYWKTRLDAVATCYGFDEGYKLSYQPLSWIPDCTHAFISLNPGNKRSFYPSHEIEDPVGNSYVEEVETSKSPINKQFIALYKLLGVPVSQVMATVVHPYRSGRWQDLSKEQKQGGLGLGREWLAECLHDGIKTITTIGRDAERVVSSMLDAQLDEEAPSGWGKVKLRRYVCADGRVVVALPHLSTFKLMSRPECIAALADVYV